MIMSLSNLRRNTIKTEIWLDQKDHTPDRFMGYTITLMPLLEELCGLAEDIRRNAQPIQAITYGRDDIPLITWKVKHIRSCIQSWRWDSPKGVSATLSERLMTHANAYRAAALLMLFRLLHGAGSSVESDQEALGMAREIMMQLKRPPEELKLSTWPALIASCELQSEDDRVVAINVFRSIYSVRKTGTSLQTLKFVTDRVWKARDEGYDWDWMTLSQQFPGECVPL
jgi:Fungal specific transcription factor domain